MLQLRTVGENPEVARCSPLQTDPDIHHRVIAQRSAGCVLKMSDGGDELGPAGGPPREHQNVALGIAVVENDVEDTGPAKEPVGAIAARQRILGQVASESFAAI